MANLSNECNFQTHYHSVRDKNSGHICTYKVGSVMENSFKNIKLNDFMSVSFVDYLSPKGLDVTYNIKESPAIFNFTIRGECRVDILEKNIEKISLCTHPGTSTVRLRSSEDNRGLFRIPPSVRYTSIAVHIEEEYLKKFLQEEAGKLPDNFMKILYENIAHPPEERFISGINPEMLSAASTILKYIRCGDINHFYLSSKANELVYLKLFQMIEQNSPKAIVMTKQDRQNIISAREIIMSNLANPPSIKKLSRLVGVNKLKLQQGFKKEFGTTVYDYLNHCRMEKALELLRKKEANVSETATLVGYSNISKFITAFKKRYGVTPGKLS